ncbi:hypothetical protein M0811_08614 [Anaeramoeba ignava]|uniref:TLDc domain-containing protein n=1 Tax=Anaeramoeba ignava TaxID=1746090 RepID=A0A9Q0RAV4_ANAIG|nr:hypothetical protein M0811_08614 [Anaeramoeba ignava]
MDNNNQIENQIENQNQNQNQIENQNQNQIENQNQNENENEMKNLEKKEKEKEKEKEKGIEKKRLFHSFFSLFDKDSISKQDFDKLNQFNFFPKSFLVDIQNKVIQDKDKQNQEMKIEIEDKLKKELDKKDKEIEDKNKEIEDKNKEIEDKNKEKPIKKNFPQFSDSEIIKDIEYVKKLKEWINDNDFFSKMKKGFSAKRDGFSSSNFHSKADNHGKTLVIIKTSSNYIFGGFTQVGYKSNVNNFINDSNAFIFTLKNPSNHQPQKFTCKLPQYAIYSYSTHGPSFGGGYDIYINQNFNQGSYINFGHSYNTPNGINYQTNEAKNYFAGNYNQ